MTTLKIADKDAGEAEEKPVSAGRRVPVKRILVTTVLLALIGGGSWYGWSTWTYHQTHVDTDDAQIEAHIAPVVPRAGGYVTEVLVEDNQRVNAGDPVVRIDTRDYDARIVQADAALSNAEAAVSVARANLEAAKTMVVKDEADRKRLAVLREKDEVSQQQFDAVSAAHDAAVAQQTAASRQIVAAEAQVAQKRADIEYAKLQKTYTVVPAPVSGMVSKKSIEVGQFVQSGQSLMAIVDDTRPWIVANYKETQLASMRIGQPVDIEVDAYPGTVFHGKVASMAGATGAKFSLLPPDNASGNFVKVVQRVPVKIELTDPADPAHPLRAGMSVVATVIVH